MQTTTTEIIRVAFVTAIQGINDTGPTFAPMRDIRWSYTPVKRKGGRAMLQGMATRNFDLIFGRGKPSYLFFGNGETYVAPFKVAVSYSGVEPELRDHMFQADAVDLRRVLSMLRDPTLPGLCDLIDTGSSNENFDLESTGYAEHAFELHWYQDTNTY